MFRLILFDNYVRLKYGRFKKPPMYGGKEATIERVKSMNSE